MNGKRRRLGIAVAILATAVVLSLTLFPGVEQDERFRACVLCGDRFWADFLLNVALFGPFGVGLRAAGLSTRTAIYLALLFSGFVEVAQIAIPGRYPSYSDLMANTLGTVSGVLTPTVLFWARDVGRRQARHIALWAALAFSFAVLATGVLLRPSFPHNSPYFGQWTADFGHMEWYRARIQRVTLGGDMQLRSWRLQRWEEVRERLIAGAELRIEAIAGPPIPALGPLFGVMDENRVEIELVGPDRDDLVTRYRTVAADLLLDQPDLRAGGIMAGIGNGDPLDVSVTGLPPNRCVRVNAAEQCRLGFSAGIGWAFLMYPEHLGPWQKGLLSSGWLFAMVFPVGFFSKKAGGWWGRGIPLIPLVAAAVTPAVGLLFPPPTEWVGLVGGLVAGWITSALVRARTPNSAQAADSLV